jgi:DNA modification methylase
MKLENLRIADLTPDPQNARQHDDKNLKVIMGSLKEFGQRKPIVITEAGVIVAGNGTVEAAKRLGWLDIEVVRVPSDWTDAQVKAFAIADNRTAELANWNQEVLTSQLLELEAEGWELAEFGFEAFELPDEDKPIIEDEIPESAPSRVALGDVWQLGRHRLMCGDATESDSIDTLFQNEIAELCFTSPPYSDQREYNGGKKLSTEHLALFIKQASNVCNYFAVNLGISRKDHALVRYWDDYISAAEESNLKLLSWNIWNRQGLAGFSVGQITAMFAIEHEWIFIFGKKSKQLNKTVSNKDAGKSNEVSNRQKNGDLTYSEVEIGAKRQLGTVYSGGVESQPVGNHPATFPIDFPITYIKAMTIPGDNIYEPFAGSGTTIIAAEKTDRNCFAFELDPKYCDVIIERWEKLTGQKAELLPAKAD